MNLEGANSGASWGDMVPSPLNPPVLDSDWYLTVCEIMCMPQFIPGIFWGGGISSPLPPKKLQSPPKKVPKLCALNLFLAGAMNYTKI